MQDSSARGGPPIRPITTLCIAAIPILVVACGPPVIYDTAHQAVRNPRITASVDNGWLAVDSTEAGVRLVVELNVEGPAGAADFLPLHLLRLHCTVSGEHRPAKVLLEEASCPTPLARSIRCPEGASLDECDRIREEAGQDCLFTIRAEFLFDEMPHLDENEHFFTFGQTEQPIRWVKASGS